MAGRNMETVVRVENLTCAYGDTVILEDISFDVRRGEIFVVLGGSGCGKSTLLKHLIGLYEPPVGEIEILGTDMIHGPDAEREALLRRIGVAYQSGALFGSMSLLQNVRLPLEEFTDLPSEAVDVVAKLKLSMVGLEDSCFLMPSALSGGMKKRAAIARAMALDPEIIFLDEPSAGLDPVTAAGLDELLRELAHTLGVTFVMVSHELASILSVADRVIMLDKGFRGIVARGDPRTLRDESDNPVVRRFFNREPERVEAEGMDT